jgi:hypothetical protein
MINNVFICLKSGKEIDIKDFECVTYPNNSTGESTTIKDFKNFYLYDRLLTFVGKSDIVTLKSTEIEYINFFSTSAN